MDRPATDTPMWLSHHWPENYLRCVRIGKRHVCRRCSVLYPIALLAMMVALALDVPTGAAVAAMWVLPLPMTLEWMVEHLRGVPYSPRRQATVSAVAAVGVGLAFAVHARNPFLLDALAPMAAHATACAVSSIVATRRGLQHGHQAVVLDWERRHEAAEERRQSALRQLLADQDTDPMPWSDPPLGSSGH
jgi:hypothetical protein